MIKRKPQVKEQLPLPTLINVTSLSLPLNLYESRLRIEEMCKWKNK